MALTNVLNLSTGETTSYSLPPEKAVVNAYYQAKGDYNWWTYLSPDNHPEFRVNKFTVSCGDFTALAC